VVSNTCDYRAFTNLIAIKAAQEWHLAAAQEQQAVAQEQHLAFTAFLRLHYDSSPERKAFSSAFLIRLEVKGGFAGVHDKCYFGPS